MDFTIEDIRRELRDRTLKGIRNLKPRVEYFNRGTSRISLRMDKSQTHFEFYYDLPMGGQDSNVRLRKDFSQKFNRLGIDLDALIRLDNEGERNGVNHEKNYGTFSFFGICDGFRIKLED